MIARRFARPRLILAALVLAAGLATPSVALGLTTVSTSVTIHAPATAAIGSEVIVTATIRRADGVNPVGLRVGLYIGGEYSQSSHADVKGNLDFRVRGAATETAGKFALQARFDGAHGLAPSSASTSIQLRPALIKISTVPAVPGIPISVGTAKGTTGPDGVATVSVDHIGSVDVNASLDQIADKSVRVSFIRWGDQVFNIERSIDVRGDATYVMGLRTAYQASLKFVDLAGDPIDPSLVTRARFTSSTGGELVLSNFDNAWWEAGTAVSRTGGLQPSTTLWRLSEVTMAGTNVVNQGQQAFSPTINGTWTISLLLFDLVVHAQDAVSGSAIKGTAILTFPDSSTRTQAVGPDGSTLFRGLPRGSYTIAMKFDGISPPTPIALSRTQDALIRVISYVDLAGAVILVLLVGFVLLYIGRRRHVMWLARAGSATSGAVRGATGRLTRSSAVRPVPSALARVSSDLTTITGGRFSSAVRFARLVIGRFGGLIGSLITAGVQGVTTAPRHVMNLFRQSSARARERSADRQAAAAVTPAAEATPAVAPASGVAMPSGAMTASAATPTTTAAASAPARRRRRTATTEPSPPSTPAWPERPARIATSGEPHATVFSRPQGGPAVIRTVGATAPAQSWFEPEPDEGPTHECRQCHRQVPDSARFCRSCGRLQT